MSENEKIALMYYYLSVKKGLDTGQIFGLKRKACLDFVKLIRNLSFKLDSIKDLEEVLSYGK